MVYVLARSFVFSVVKQDNFKTKFSNSPFEPKTALREEI